MTTPALAHPAPSMTSKLPQSLSNPALLNAQERYSVSSNQAECKGTTAGSPMMKFTHTGASCPHQGKPSGLGVSPLPDASCPVPPPWPQAI